jgi:formylglycine-generating enzyme required for sulfatase activity
MRSINDRVFYVGVILKPKKNMNKLLLLWLLLMTASVVQGKRHYVGFDNTNSAPAGSEVITKTTTSQLGADLLSVMPASGDTVLIAWGRYYLTSELIIPAGVVVQGGYNPDASATLTRTYPGAVYPSGAPTFANMTILDGNAFFTSSRAKKHRVATVKGTLETCYIRGGHTNELNGIAPERLHGGGLYIDGGTVVSCIIRGNVANNITSRATTPALGGGVYLINGGKIYNSVVTNNMANGGYGVYGEAGCIITNATIIYNTFAPISVLVPGTGDNIAQNGTNTANYYLHQVHSTDETAATTYTDVVKIQLTDFYLGATEATCLQYCAFLASIDYTGSGIVHLANNYRDSLWTLKVYGTNGNKTVRAYYGTTVKPSTHSDESYCATYGYQLCATTSDTNSVFGYLYQRNNIVVPKESTNIGIIPDDDISVCHVSWYGSLAYCQWLGGSLPTEAQWKFALRRKNSAPFQAPLGATTAIGDQSASLYNYAYAYAGYVSGGVSGSVVPDYAWYIGNSASVDYANYGVGIGTAHPHKVGERKPNGLGLYDMNGNIFEWCADLYKSFTYDISHYNNANSNDGRNINVVLNPINNAVGSYSPPYRIHRGGSWFNAAYDLRAGLRYYYTASYRASNIGFRPAFLSPFAP